MFETIYAQAVAAVALIVIVFAFLKGDDPERIAAGAYALAALAAAIMPRGEAEDVNWGLMGLDVVQLLVFVGVAWQSRRNWAIWVSAFQALIVTGYVLVALNLRPPMNALAAMINLCSYALLITLAVGTFWAWQERRAAALSSTGKL